MIRLLGAITGSALALATLLVVIGIPQFRAEPSSIDRDVVTLLRATSPVDGIEADMQAEPQPLIADLTDPVPADEPIAETGDPVADAAIAVNDTRDAESVAETRSDVVETEQFSERPEPDPVMDEMQNWYAFWSPFRSEIAASGFVEQLQRVTGLDYRVVKVKPGVYEVAFAYSEDTDILDNLSQITAATGLQLPEN